MQREEFEIINFDYKQKFLPIKWCLSFQVDGVDLVLTGWYEDDILVSELTGMVPNTHFQDIFDRYADSNVYKLVDAVRPTKIAAFLKSDEAPSISGSIHSYQQVSELAFTHKCINPLIAQSLAARI